jgi:DNA polymerase-3 subunit chi
MSDYRFYHLQTKTLDQALPELLTKALSLGHRIVVRTADKAATERLNEQLWTYRPDSFLPHGSAKDGQADRQPIYLTENDDNPNQAALLVLTHGEPAEDADAYALCCDIFDGSDETALSKARNRWKLVKEAGHEVTYWQQTEKGWEKKA